MTTVGHIKAEVLLKIDGMEDTYSVGHLEIPVNISTDDKRPMHANVRADTSGVARDLEKSVDGVSITVDGAQMAGVLRNHSIYYTKENY